MTLADAMSLRSRCGKKVGAVIVSVEERVVATGYNGPPAGLVVPEHGSCKTFCSRLNQSPKPASYDSCPSNHAEINALLWSSRQERLGGTIYITTAPCMSCAKAIANSGLAMAVWTKTEEKPHRSPQEVKDFLELCGIGYGEVS
jgi:dCMP deaminase